MDEDSSSHVSLEKIHGKIYTNIYKNLIKRNLFISKGMII